MFIKLKNRKIPKLKGISLGNLSRINLNQKYASISMNPKRIKLYFINIILY